MATPAAPDKSRFIQDITIRNFKCFEELKIEGCGQFNLILGDNNVGKTSVLEALLVNEDAQYSLDNLLARRHERYSPEAMPLLYNSKPYEGLIGFYCKRKFERVFDFSIQLDTGSSEKSGLIEIREIEIRTLPAKQQGRLKELGSTATTAIWHIASGEQKLIPIDGPVLGGHMPFISIQRLYTADLVDYFGNNISPSNEHLRSFTNALKSFIPSIERIEIGVNKMMGNELVVRLHDQDHTLPLASLGDGSIKLARILLEMPTTKNARLMIDEIDTGIHYTRFTTLWRTTLKAAIDNNVQLFITTHNIECLRALNQVLATEEFADYREECRSFTLERLPSGIVKAFRYNYSQFEYAINAEMELRGRYL